MAWPTTTCRAGRGQLPDRHRARGEDLRRRDDTEYGAGFAKAVRSRPLGSASIKSCEGDVRRGERDFSAIISTITNAPLTRRRGLRRLLLPEAAPLAAEQLKPCRSVDHLRLRRRFERSAVHRSSPAAPPGCGPDYRRAVRHRTSSRPPRSKFKQAPGVYSVEAYDRRRS